MRSNDNVPADRSDPPAEGKLRRESTPAQRRASRENGRKSKGPKTAAGKERAKYNAVKHGALAMNLAPQPHMHYEHGLFSEIVSDFSKDYAPQTTYDYLVIGRMAMNALQRQRAYIAMQQKMATSPPFMPTEPPPYGPKLEARAELLQRAGMKIRAGRKCAIPKDLARSLLPLIASALGRISNDLACYRADVDEAVRAGAVSDADAARDAGGETSSPGAADEGAGPGPSQPPRQETNAAPGDVPAGEGEGSAEEVGNDAGGAGTPDGADDAAEANEAHGAPAPDPTDDQRTLEELQESYKHAVAKLAELGHVDAVASGLSEPKLVLKVLMGTRRVPPGTESQWLTVLGSAIHWCWSTVYRSEEQQRKEFWNQGGSRRVEQHLKDLANLQRYVTTYDRQLDRDHDRLMKRRDERRGRRPRRRGKRR
jgi:hypothetical protein